MQYVHIFFCIHVRAYNDFRLVLGEGTLYLNESQLAKLKKSMPAMLLP